jgi:hypothetical protein
MHLTAWWLWYKIVCNANFQHKQIIWNDIVKDIITWNAFILLCILLMSYASFKFCSIFAGLEVNQFVIGIATTSDNKKKACP